MGPQGLTHRDQTPRSLRESAPCQQSRAPKGELFSQLSTGTSRSASALHPALARAVDRAQTVHVFCPHLVRELGRAGAGVSVL